MIEVSNVQALRSMTGNSEDLAYCNGPPNIGDGGDGISIQRTDAIFVGTGLYNQDNNGTIIKASSNDTGRWVRQYEEQ